MTSGGQDEKAVVEWLGGQKGAMLNLLEDIVNIDGGSYDKAGVDAVGVRLRKFLEDQGIACETIACVSAANNCSSGATPAAPTPNDP